MWMISVGWGRADRMDRRGGSNDDRDAAELLAQAARHAVEPAAWGMSAEPVRIPEIRSYDSADMQAWEDLIGRSCNGTFLHTRRFVSYHGNRFLDQSLLLEDHRGHLAGVFPAAENPADPQMVISHPGLSYGGIVHDGSVCGESMIGALEGISRYYRRLGYKKLRYKAVPAIYHSRPAEDDLYALFRLGARQYRSDLSVTIDLSNRGRVTQRRVRSRKRALSEGVSTEENWGEVAAFWRILEQNLACRHGVSPVHSLAEIQLLRDRFPESVLLIAARIGRELVGGAVMFAAGPVMHMQYTATTEHGRNVSATDLVMEHAIELGATWGCRYFDFGVCTVDDGQGLDQDLYRFKVSFGAGGVIYDHYELDLV
jgi:Acetyltransferase (GNAT) domain